MKWAKNYRQMEWNRALRNTSTFLQSTDFNEDAKNIYCMMYVFLV